ncbi:MAG: hypothetical protein J5494_08085 [Candidatus Methanomethylophilaceae archaeon]|nr:hypothetical protein [Candidatus Methanomethylophilaceae archaeon]
MNTKDEIVRIFDDKGGDTHPPAIFTQTGTLGQMEACGAFWPEANYDASKMAELALQTNKMFGFATVRVPYCITVDANAFGCDIDKGTRTSQPSVKGYKYCSDGIIGSPADLISPDEFMENSQVRTVLEAAGKLSGNEDLFVVSGMNDPVACIDNLLGMENVMMALLEDPGIVTPWLDAVLPHLRTYCSALSEASDDVMIIAEASSDLFPADYFDTIFEPYLPRQIKSAKSSFCTLHTCGGTMDVAGRLASLGMDGISLEASWDPPGYMDAVGGKTLMLGCINPVDVLLQKDPETVKAKAKESAKYGFDIITPECGVPPLTPDENLRALAEYRD